MRLWLRCAGRMITLSHSASTFVIARTPIDLPPGNAEIVFEVDDERYERPVTLPSGMSADDRETMVLSRDTVSPF